MTFQRVRKVSSKGNRISRSNTIQRVMPKQCKPIIVGSQRPNQSSFQTIDILCQHGNLQSKLCHHQFHTVTSRSGSSEDKTYKDFTDIPTYSKAPTTIPLGTASIHYAYMSHQPSCQNTGGQPRWVSTQDSELLNTQP